MKEGKIENVFLILLAISLVMIFISYVNKVENNRVYRQVIEIQTKMNSVDVKKGQSSVQIMSKEEK